MNRTILAFSIAAITLGTASATLAQGVSVTVAPEERTRIKEYVVKEKVKPITVKERISVGAKLPTDVELQTVPSTWGASYTKYRYVYSDDNVYLVEPSSREVIQVIN
ncbi:DUF1236 domain-containing protein [bacterium]|nr:MAG: DUF1236 domain-containing protein [bacterium]